MISTSSYTTICMHRYFSSSVFFVPFGTSWTRRFRPLMYQNAKKSRFLEVRCRYVKRTVLPKMYLHISQSVYLWPRTPSNICRFNGVDFQSFSSTRVYRYADTLWAKWCVFHICKTDPKKAISSRFATRGDEND